MHDNSGVAFTTEHSCPS